MHGFIGRTVSIDVQVIIDAATTLPTAHLLGRLDKGYAENDREGGDEGVAFDLDVADPKERQTSFSVWSDSLHGREFGDGVAWRVEPLLVSVQAVSDG
ncbi:MAG TPA: hypothetical protein VE688_10090 [Gaiellaceae bacterium]|nr:hypothetical protein [Gaiellaceae bacterium]